MKPPRVGAAFGIILGSRPMVRPRRTGLKSVVGVVSGAMDFLIVLVVVFRVRYLGSRPMVRPRRTGLKSVVGVVSGAMDFLIVLVVVFRVRYLGSRPMVGQRPLKPFIMVRIHASQH